MTMARKGGMRVKGSLPTSCRALLTRLTFGERRSVSKRPWRPLWLQWYQRRPRPGHLILIVASPGIHLHSIGFITSQLHLDRKWVTTLVCPQLVSALLEQNPYLQWWPDICTNKIPVPSVGHLWYLPEHLYYYLPEHHHGKLQVGPRLAVGFPGSWCCRTPNSLGVSHLYNFSTT